MELPKEGLSAPTLHLPISLEFKESFHLSASGTWNRFAAKEGWAALRIFKWGWGGGDQVQEGTAGASPVSLPPVCCGTSGPGLGFPGLTTKARLTKAETPTPPLRPPSVREPWVHTAWTTCEVRWLGGLTQDEPCLLHRKRASHSE